MLLVILIIVAALLIWWFKRECSLSRNEWLYLKSRGYAREEVVETGPPVTRDARLLGLMESLGDISAYARQKAAEELSRICAEGQKDPRILASLLKALNDQDASVRSSVAKALGDLGDRRAVEPLRQRIQEDDSIHFRAVAKKVLEKLGG